MMVPAGILTMLMTAAYGAIADHPLAHAALAGMGPATGGMTIALAAILARDTGRRGRAAFVDSGVVLIAFALLTFTAASSVVVIVVAAGAGALVLGRQRPTSEHAIT